MRMRSVSKERNAPMLTHAKSWSENQTSRRRPYVVTGVLPRHARRESNVHTLMAKKNCAINSLMEPLIQLKLLPKDTKQQLITLLDRLLLPEQFRVRRPLPELLRVGNRRGEPHTLARLIGACTHHQSFQLLSSTHILMALLRRTTVQTAGKTSFLSRLFNQ